MKNKTTTYLGFTIAAAHIGESSQSNSNPMQMTDIKPQSSSDPKERTLEWQKLIHAAAGLIMAKNLFDKSSASNEAINWSHCGDAAETFNLIARAAEWMGITPEQIQQLANELK